MRSEEAGIHTSTNGLPTTANGATPKKMPVSSSVNGHSLASSSNAVDTVQTNGSTRSPVRLPDYFGHDREEVTRILIQSLHDLGYNEAAKCLTRESHFELESPSVSAFRNAVLEGRWPEAEAILLRSHAGHERHSSASDLSLDGPAGLILADGANKSQMLFWMRQQKFLEYLDQRHLSKALGVLRQELTPLNHDINQLHALSSLLMCSPEDWRAQAHWGGSVAESRQQLLHELTGK